MHSQPQHGKRHTCSCIAVRARAHTHAQTQTGELIERSRLSLTLEVKFLVALLRSFAVAALSAREERQKGAVRQSRIPAGPRKTGRLPAGVGGTYGGDGSDSTAGFEAK